MARTRAATTTSQPFLICLAAFGRSGGAILFLSLPGWAAVRSTYAFSRPVAWPMMIVIPSTSLRGGSEPGRTVRHDKPQTHRDRAPARFAERGRLPANHPSRRPHHASTVPIQNHPGNAAYVWCFQVIQTVGWRLHLPIGEPYCVVRRSWFAIAFDQAYWPVGYRPRVWMYVVSRILGAPGELGAGNRRWKGRRPGPQEPVMGLGRRRRRSCRRVARRRCVGGEHGMG